MRLHLNKAIQELIRRRTARRVFVNLNHPALKRWQLATMVYVLIRNRRVTYIGHTKFGLSRPCGNGHHVLHGEFLEDDRLHCWYFARISDAQMLEKWLIDHFKPELNIAYNPARWFQATSPRGLTP